MLEDVPGRHGDHPRTNTFGDQLFMSFHRHADLAPRGDEDHLGNPAGSIGEYISAARDTGRRRVPGSVQRRERLQREREYGRLVAKLQDVAVSLDDSLA